MPPRPPPSSRAGAGRTGGRPGADSPASSRNRPGRGPAAAPEDEDFAAPLTGEEGYPEDGPPNPELYGETEEPRSRTGETRVASVREVEQERPRDEEEDDNPDATRAGPPVQMVVLAGPDRGRKKRFQSVRMVVGRGKDCDFVLEDQTVSRRHLELVYGEGGVVMRDLGSVSGTQVNDQKVDECVLKHGDEVSVGKTRLRFVDEAEQIKELRAQAEAREAEEKKEREEAAQEEKAAREARQSTSAARGSEIDPNDPRLNEATNANYKVSDLLKDGQSRGKGAVAVPRRPPVRGGASRSGGGLAGRQKALIAVAAGVLVLLVVGMMLRPSGPPPPPPVDPKVERAQVLMQKARDSVRANEFAAAVKLVEEAEALVPGIDAENLAAAAKKQQQVLDAFQVVRALIDEKKFKEARDTLASTPQGTAKTDGMRQQLEEELDEKELAWNLQQVEEALATREPETVRPLLDLLPAANRPAYEVKLADLEEELAKEAADAARQGRISRERAAQAAKEKRKAFIEEAFVEVERHFNGGQYQRAVLECDRVVDKHKGDKEVRDRALALKRLIPQFKTTMDDAQKKLAMNALESAARPLRKAAELYRQIGFKGSLGDTIDEQLASSSMVAGNAAMKKGDLAAAGSHFREAMRLNPGDGRAREGLDALQKKVEELYMRAYIQKDRDPRAAAEMLKVVIEVASEGSDVKRKAEMYLSELQP